MRLQVEATEAGHRLVGDGVDIELINRFLKHLSTRNFAMATGRAYAYDLLIFGRFCAERRLSIGALTPTDVFDFLDWQSAPRRPGGDERMRRVVPLRNYQGAAPATMNRRIAALRGLCEYAVLAGVRADNPVPAARRSSGARVRRGLLGHLGPGRPRGGGRLVRTPRRLPEALDAAEVAAFIADLRTARDRAMALLMLLGGLRAGEVRALLLPDVDLGLRRVRVTGKGGRQRVVPVDGVFFTELAAYLRWERPPGCRTVECFVVLRGPTAGGPLTEAGLRRIFRSHRATAGTPRVRPHWLRHTYGTQLAAAGIDLLVLRELMGHASPETTAGYVHLSAATLAAEYSAARARIEASC
jgi:integrase/recombinase XerC